MPIAISEQKIGLAAAFSAFTVWGFFPIYFDVIGSQVSPWEILAHRIIWTAVLLGAFVLLAGRSARVAAVFSNRRLRSLLLLSALLVAGNWGTFIWAVTHGRVLQASLGYYINPLLNVALGFFFLGERLRPLQWLAVAIATAGVLFTIVAYGTIPWVSLVLAGCFGGYGLIRKQLAVDGATGLLVETLWLSPFALAGVGWLYANGEAGFLTIGPRTDLLLVGAGVLTIIPFVLFVVGAQRLRLGTVGLIQYLTPTLQFMSGVWLFGEPLTHAALVTFACIWLGLFIYTLDLLRRQSIRAVPD